MSLFRDESSPAKRPSIYPMLKDVLVSFYEHPCTDYFRLDDPLPFCYDVLRTVRGRQVYGPPDSASRSEK